MSDMFTLQTVTFTPNIGMTLKNFRIENKVTAKSITEKFGKAQSYITKLEKGDIKKIDSELLIQICNFIVGSEDGLSGFLNRLAQNYTEYDTESKIIEMNIGDLLLEHQVPTNLIVDINNYMESNNLSIEQLTHIINANEDISKVDNFDSLPENIWYSPNNDIDNVVIKLNIPQLYIEDLLSGKISSFHRVIAEAIVYSLYKLGKEDNPQLQTLGKLDLYNLLPIRRVIRKTQTDKEYKSTIFEPDTADAFNGFVRRLKNLISMTNEYGSKKIKQVYSNTDNGLGFYFAYMAVDLTELQKKDRTVKQQFLDEVKELVEKYSKEDTGIDLYE